MIGCVVVAFTRGTTLTFRRGTIWIEGKDSWTDGREEGRSAQGTYNLLICFFGKALQGCGSQQEGIQKQSRWYEKVNRNNNLQRNEDIPWYQWASEARKRSFITTPLSLPLPSGLDAKSLSPKQSWSCWCTARTKLKQCSRAHAATILCGEADSG